MSTRERWIVYPLLLMALLLGVKDRIPPRSQIQCRNIECNELIVKSLDGQRRVRIGDHAGQSSLIVFAQQQRPALILQTQPDGGSGQVQVIDAEGSPSVVLGSTSDGGRVELYSGRDQPALWMGYDRHLQLAGLAAIDKQNHPVALVLGPHALTASHDADGRPDNSAPAQLPNGTPPSPEDAAHRSPHPESSSSP